tara:strand:- start:1605 stop:1808 length:204 start_codon:yes stop_codon:yes gene_type:complete
MANMSYCRFENTTRDMEDCIYAIENKETDDLSNYEVNALEDFVQIAKNILNLEEEINDIIEKHRNGN